MSDSEPVGISDDPLLSPEFFSPMKLPNVKITDKRGGLAQAPPIRDEERPLEEARGQDYGPAGIPTTGEYPGIVSVKPDIPSVISVLDPLMPGDTFWRGHVQYQCQGVADLGLVIVPVGISAEGMKRIRRLKREAKDA